MSDFVHLHLHSEYSLLDGACRISEIPKKAKAQGHTAAAITDHGNLFGAVAFYDACKKEGIKPIIGCEVYVSRGDRREKSGAADIGFANVKYDHLVLLVKDGVGYQNLIHLVSCGYLEGFYARPRIDLSILREHSEGLIALSACLAGCIPRALLNSDYDGALRYAKELERIMGKGNFYLELQDHGLQEDAAVCRGLLQLSKDSGIPLVATNDTHYLEKSDAEAQQVLMCIQTASQITDGRPKGFETDEFYYKSTAEMEALFAAYPGAVENTVKIAERCNFEFDFTKKHLPSFGLPKGESAEKHLRRLAEEGLKRRLEQGELDLDHHTEEDYKFRMIYEMLIIAKMGYCDYYLIVRDFVTHAKEMGIPTGPGRGSGAGSIVAYLVGITEIDSIRYNLLFERFLNPERVSMPDFDVDFCYNRRDEVIRYVEEKYGRDRVCQIAAFGTLAARAAIRDVGRALAMPYGEVDRIAKLVPRELGITLRSAMEKQPELRSAYENDRGVKRLLDISMAVEGMPRHVTTHAAGIVITKDPVSSYVPLTVSGDVVLSQFGMEAMEKLGLLKFDFLALRYLTVIDDTERLVRKKEPAFRIDKIPLDDPDTYALLCAGDSEGVFQLESPGMRRLLTNMRPRCIEDIMIAIALYRPGPMESIPKYLQGRNDPSGRSCELDAVREILEETGGCIVYQEQVMQIFRKVAGYSYGKADVVRKAMAKKHPEQMEKERASFLEGASKNHVDGEAAERLFDEMASFASYAFNKSHAAAYSYLSYRTAYLKAHYRAAYFASLLTSVLESPVKMAEYIADCGKAGISVLPPDVNASECGFTAEGLGRGHIRFGLGGMKSVGEGFAKALCEERRKGSFSSFRDLLLRMNGKGLNRQQLQSMIYAGALDCFGLRRSQLLEAIDPLLSELNENARRNLSGQTGFLDSLEGEDGAYRYPDIPEIPRQTLLLREREATGLNFSGGVMDEYSSMMKTMRVTKISAILSMREGQEDPALQDKAQVTVCGIVMSVSMKQTKKGESLAFVELQDGSGSMEVLFFREALANVKNDLRIGSALYVHGTVSEKEDEAPKLLAVSAGVLTENASYIDDSKPAEQMAAAEPAVTGGRSGSPAAKKLYLRVPEMGERDPVYRRAAALLMIFTGPTPVVYFSKRSGKYYDSNIRIAATDFVLREMEEIVGKGNMVLR